MPLPPAKDSIELNARYLENQRITGYGANVTMHYPCPFCAEPDFMVLPLLDTRGGLEKGSVCTACKRGCRAIFVDLAGGVRFHLVQTEGPDAPDWFFPKMERATPDEQPARCDYVVPGGTLLVHRWGLPVSAGDLCFCRQRTADAFLAATLNEATR